MASGDSGVKLRARACKVQGRQVLHAGADGTWSMMSSRDGLPRLWVTVDCHAPRQVLDMVLAFPPGFPFLSGDHVVLVIALLPTSVQT